MKALTETVMNACPAGVLAAVCALVMAGLAAPRPAVAACSITSVQAHNLGSYIWGSAVQLTSTSTVTVTCETADQFILALDPGLNPTCYRNMAGPVSDMAGYTLTKSGSSDGDLWADTSSFWLEEFGAEPGSNTYTVFGWTMGQPTEAGLYQDTVTVRLIRMSDRAVIDTGTLAVQMNVEGSCYIDLVNNMSFGSFPTNTGSDRTATGSIEFRCTPDILYQVGMDEGLYYTEPTGRRMYFDDLLPRYMAYEVYRDPGHTARWGGLGSGDEYSGTGDPGETNTLTIYGLVQGADTNVLPGTYNDTLTVTVQY